MCRGQGKTLGDIFLILSILPLLLVWRMPVWLISLARESRDLPLPLSLPHQCWNLSLYLTLGFGLTFLRTGLKSLQNKHVNLLRCVLTDFSKVGTYNHLYLVVQYGTSVQVHLCESWVSNPWPFTSDRCALWWEHPWSFHPVPLEFPTHHPSCITSSCFSYLLLLIFILTI